MTRTTRNIGLGLLGSVALAGCFLSCSGCGADDRPYTVDKNGNRVYSSTGTTRRRYYSGGRSWWWSRPSYYSGGSSYSPSPSVGHSTPGVGGSRPSSGTTSRGGFGGIGGGSSSGS